MGGPRRKPHLPLADEPILCRTVAMFETCSLVDAIVVVVAAGEVANWRQTLQEHGFLKVRAVVAGGATRQQSVWQGIQHAQPADLILVHDGVRPLVTHKLIAACVEAAFQWGAAIAAVPVKDTIKRADPEGFVQDTLDRAALWAVQTPQVFRADLLVEAHRRALQEGWEATDDAALVEKLGHPVKLVPADSRNLKITTPEDLVIAEALFRHEMKAQEEG